LAKIYLIIFSDPKKLLQTRRGRCGEWANVSHLYSCHFQDIYNPLCSALHFAVEPLVLKQDLYLTRRVSYSGSERTENKSLFIDHVWTEVFSESEQRWIHCDACEEAWDRVNRIVVQKEM
jgi:peptide-N4-(N-acetyl-beta-glucosaminyl)asparagine amidase